jgi:hypothetical protein
VQEPGAEGVGGHIGRSQPPSQQCRLKGVVPQTGQPLLGAAIGQGKGAVDLQPQGERSERVEGRAGPALIPASGPASRVGRRGS